MCTRGKSVIRFLYLMNTQTSIRLHLTKILGSLNIKQNFLIKQLMNKLPTLAHL